MGSELEELGKVSSGFKEGLSEATMRSNMEIKFYHTVVPGELGVNIFDTQNKKSWLLVATGKIETNSENKPKFIYYENGVDLQPKDNNRYINSLIAADATLRAAKLNNIKPINVLMKEVEVEYKDKKYKDIANSSSS